MRTSSKRDTLTRQTSWFWDVPIVGLGLALAGFGVLSVVSGDFAFQWEPVPADIPHRVTFAVVSGLVEILAALVLAVPRWRRPGALAACLVFAGWTALHVPALGRKPLEVSVWLGAAEAAALALGIFLVATEKTLTPRGTQLRSGAVVLFGAALVVFGLSHFAYASFTAEMVPSWMPMRLALAYFTGAAHAAAGFALMVGVWRGPVAVLEGLMMASFVLLVHVPRVVSQPASRLEWTMLIVATALTCSSLLVARQFVVGGAPSSIPASQNSSSGPAWQSPH
jgi:uncharacterized membrane protein